MGLVLSILAVIAIIVGVVWLLNGALLGGVILIAVGLILGGYGGHSYYGGRSRTY